MSKQQDELREQIHILLIDYDHAGMWQGSASKEIMKLVNSAMQTALLRSTDGVRRLQTYKMTEGAEDVMVIRDEAVSAIEEVRKDCE